jgi:hypothetical protein
LAFYGFVGCVTILPSFLPAQPMKSLESFGNLENVLDKFPSSETPLLKVEQKKCAHQLLNFFLTFKSFPFT